MTQNLAQTDSFAVILETFKMNTATTRNSNNNGAYQYGESYSFNDLNALNDKALPVYCDGRNIATGRCLRP